MPVGNIKLVLTSMLMSIDVYSDVYTVLTRNNDIQ